jgi:hypothetical protein
MYNNLLIFVTLIFLNLVGVCQAQDSKSRIFKFEPDENPPGTHRTITLENGEKVREFVPHPGSTAEAVSLAVDDRIYLQESTEEGKLSVLELLSAEDVGLFSDLELLQSQKSDLNEIGKSYADSMKNATRRQAVSVRVAHLKKLEKVLLPEQMNAVVRKVHGKRLFSRILTAKLSQKIKLTREQEESIVTKCAELNISVKELVEEVKERKLELQNRLLDIYFMSLTKDQQKQIGLEEEVKSLVESMSVFDMDADTEFKRK